MLNVILPDPLSQNHDKTAARCARNSYRASCDIVRIDVERELCLAIADQEAMVLGIGIYAFQTR